MFTTILKNVKKMFTGQKLLSLLLVMNIIISCLVICFSYGLYRNYQTTLAMGKEEEINSLSAYVDEENTVLCHDGDYEFNVVEITPEEIRNFALSLSDETKGAVELVAAVYLLETPLWTTDNDPYDEIYSDDLEPAYKETQYWFSIVGDKLVPFQDDKEYFSDEDLESGNKIVSIGMGYYNKRHSTGGRDFGAFISNRDLTEDIKQIKIEDEYYTLRIHGERDDDYSFRIPYTAFPEDAKRVGVRRESDGNIRTCFGVSFKNNITRAQYEDVQRCLEQSFGGKLYLEPIKFTDVKELQYYRTVMLISVAIAILAAINMAILYRYILEKRTSQLAIFRICGCTKGRAILSYLLECLVINIPLFALTELIYHKLIMPRFSGIFPYMAQCYSFKMYAAIFGIYIVASMLVMLIMITATVKKHSLVALKSAPKSTGKLGVMKLFEVLQIAAVLAILVLITSAVLAKYEKYSAFGDMIERKGYMLNSPSKLDLFIEDLENVVGDREFVVNRKAGGDCFGDGNMLDGIGYSDEYIDAYAPPVADGVWLSDTDLTYEKDGVIPVVVLSSDGKYKVGDVFENDTMGFDENGQPSGTVHEKYEIVGVLEDKADIAGLMHENAGVEDYTLLYYVYSKDYEDQDLILFRYADLYACLKTNYSPVMPAFGFIFCDNDSDEEYKQLKDDLMNKLGVNVSELSVIHENSMQVIFEQMYTLFPIAVCIFILTIISTVSISAIYTKRQLRNYAIFYICGARWRTCALRSLKNSAITCGIASILAAVVLIIGKLTLLKETVISFGIWHFAVCALVIILYLALSMIMPLMIIGSNQPKEVLKEE